MAYNGPTLNEPNPPLNSTIGGVTGNILFASLEVGAIGIYKVVLQLGDDLATNPPTQLTIAQNIYISNITTIPVFAQSPSAGTPITLST